MNYKPPYRPKVSSELVEKIKRIEAKWQERWKRDGIFNANPDPSRKKYFVTFPYPYVNAYPHLGSAFTILRVDITARFKRMRGYNVLFPQGWHATGGPIVSASLRVRERDPKIMDSLRSMGIRDEDIPKFEDPMYWIEFFTKEWRRDLERYGMSIDWRREFFTTSKNPYYSKFVEWQYLKLREKGLLGRGSHPVVWCPKEMKVVGDHDRPDEYVGIGPVEAVIIKFRSGSGLVLPALTYRPETVFGVTNIWVNPDYEYRLALVEGEEWVLSEYMIRELRDQGYKVVEKGSISGRDLLGSKVVNPATGKEVPVLPASFVKGDIGTGIVMSVPAHAPFDYVALRDLKRDRSILERYNLDPSIVDDIEPVKVIDVEGVKGLLVEEVVSSLGIKGQDEEGKLDEATKRVYSKEFYEGSMSSGLGPWSGKPVSEAKREITRWMESRGDALRVYTLPTRVYCRCGARTHVKIVRDQWFILYNKPEWKSLARKALESMRVYPPHVKADLEKAIMEMREWAFTHKGELGTPLPWDKEWVIESLSDSTIYMAYYTIANYLQNPEKYGIRAEQLIPEVFDYVFLGRGDVREVSAKSGIPAEVLELMRREFDYWYPVDMRISGKDLIPNHLVFFIFHHTAVFPEDKWPRGIGINGWVLIGGEKMSKSKGNFILLREALEWWGADATRWAEVLAGADSGLDDANFEPSIADSAVVDLLSWLSFVEENFGAEGRNEWLTIDSWFESVLNRTIAEVTRLMEETKYKSALIEGFYGLQSKYKWYVRRAGKPHKELLKRFIEVQTLLIAPFAPHVAEEAWEIMGKKGYISLAPWPEADESKIRPELEKAEDIVKSVLDDAREIMKFVESPRRVVITVSAPWKYEVASRILKAREKGLQMKDAIREAIRGVEAVDKREAARLASMISRHPETLTRLVPRDLEVSILSEAREFLKNELGVEEVIVEVEEKGSSPKKGNSLPGKPAIYVS